MTFDVSICIVKAYDPWPDKGGVGEAEQAQNAMSQDKAQPLLDPYGAIMEVRGDTLAATLT